MKDIFQIKISLDNAKPSIYRTILIEPDTNFVDFHDIIQIAMGWDDYHLHQFETGDYTIAEPDEFMDIESIDPSSLTINEVLKKIGDKIKYEYDFGDGWAHTIQLEKIIPYQLNKNYPTCIRGKRACPPEDCGGIWGYENMREIIKDKKHPEYRKTIEWVGIDFDPDYFDIEYVNETLEDIDEYLYGGDEEFDDLDLDDLEDSVEVFQEHLLEVVNEQMDNNDPPETAATFKRLINLDFSHLEAKMLIAQCVSFEMISVVTEGKPFNLKRFIKNLNKLPKIDFEN
ncbi:MAG: plasmid pRiA4b ORF-3 family protein [Flavobacteriaceae bacterium]|nr:plasmid pRiA4b ORF-3 family protein [Flavobacteriaceae bacterium]